MKTTASPGVKVIRALNALRLTLFGIVVATALAFGGAAPHLFAHTLTTDIKVGPSVSLGPRTKVSGCRQGPEPDRRCSPGAHYRLLAKRVICSPSFHTSQVRDVSDATRRGGWAGMGYKERSPARSDATASGIGFRPSIANLSVTPLRTSANRAPRARASAPSVDGRSPTTAATGPTRSAMSRRMGAWGLPATSGFTPAA